MKKVIDLIEESQKEIELMLFYDTLEKEKVFTSLKKQKTNTKDSSIQKKL